MRLQHSGRARLEKILEATTLSVKDLQISEETIGARFLVKPLGEVGLATSRANKLLDAMRKQDGSWHRPEGLAPDGGVVPLFISPDKDAQTISTESALRRAKRLLEAAGKPCIIDRSSWTLRSDYIDFVRFTAESRSSISVAYNLEGLEELQAYVQNKHRKPYSS